VKAYKELNRDKSGDLHPLFVLPQIVIPVGEWVFAKEGPRTVTGKVQSKLGSLAYRPGLHLSEAPYAPHIGLRDETGKVRWMHPNTVWCECEICEENDYTMEAHANGWRNGKYCAQRACLDHIPERGFYWYTTNPNAFGNWLITSAMKVNRILSDEEVEDIMWTRYGIHAQPRKVA
jgi:hypothetical protein